MLIQNEKVPPYLCNRNRNLVSELRMARDYPRFEVIGLVCNSSAAQYRSKRWY